MQRSIKNLLYTNQNYSADTYEKCRDLIDGGRCFRDNIDKYLAKRGDCSTPTHRPSPQTDLENPFPAGEWHGKSWASEEDGKKKWFRYTPIISGILDQISGQVVDDPIRIKTEPIQAYYEVLQDRLQYLDSQICRMVLQYGCAFLAISSERQSQESSDANAKAVGDYDAIVSLISPVDVIDYEWIDDSTIKRIKVHIRDKVRSDDFGPENVNRVTVSIIDSKEILKYTWTWTDEETEPNPDTLIDPEIIPHDMGICPVVPVFVPGLWVGERILEPLLDLINIQAALRWWTVVQAHPILMANDPSNMPRSIPNTPDSCVMGSLAFAAPPAGAYDALGKEVEKAEANLSEVMATLHREGLKATQNARQSEKAKKLDMEISGNDGLVVGIRNSLKICLSRLILMIAEQRNDAIDQIDILGLSNLEARTLEARVDQIVKLKDVADYPVQAKRWEILQVSLDSNPDMPKKLKDEIIAGYDLNSLEEVEVEQAEQTQESKE